MKSTSLKSQKTNQPTNQSNQTNKKPTSTKLLNLQGNRMKYCQYLTDYIIQKCLKQIYISKQGKHWSRDSLTYYKFPFYVFILPLKRKKKTKPGNSLHLLEIAPRFLQRSSNPRYSASLLQLKAHELCDYNTTIPKQLTECLRSERDTSWVKWQNR